MPEPPQGPGPSGALDDRAAERLTGAIARGDPAALAALYEAWFDRAFAAARSLTRRDESFCLDVVQEAMLRVARSMRRMDSSDDLARWMNRVIRTAAIDLLRRETRRDRRERRSRSPVQGQPHAASPETAERLDWLRERVASLPAAEARLLNLRIARDVTLKEAGAAEGLTGDSAHGRVRRAVARLRALAKEAFGD